MSVDVHNSATDVSMLVLPCRKAKELVVQTLELGAVCTCAF